MESVNKLPLKRVEFSLTKFNEVAIPHHLDLLRQHKANILKYEEAGDYARVRAEQTHARRVTSQLRNLLAEMETLRCQVHPNDWPRFDKLTQKSRDMTLKAIMDYLGVIENSCKVLVAVRKTTPLSINRQGTEYAVSGSAVSTDSVGLVAHTQPIDNPNEDQPLIQLQAHEQPNIQEISLQEREAVLRGWTELQSEVHQLHEVWTQIQEATNFQREQIAAVASRVDVVADNVEAARAHLAVSERFRAGAYGASGAVVGALVGGPLGLMLGAKVGAAAAVAGSAFGYIGARVLGARRQRQIEPVILTQPTNVPGNAKLEHDKNQ